MANNPTFQIPQDVITPIIQAQITAAVAAALGPNAQIIEKAIVGILNTNVDSEGKPSSYGRGQSWLDWACANAIREAAKAAIDENVAGLTAAIKKQLAAEMAKKNSPMVKQLMEGMIAGAFNETTMRYRLTVQAEPR